MLTAPSATTQVTGVIGDPVEHSLSPTLHNAAFADAALDWVYVAFPVPAGRGADAVRAVTALGLRGLSVTMPHKPAAARAADRLTDRAARLGSANTVRCDGGLLVGDDTDGPGFVSWLRHDRGWDAAGRTCLVLGTGGSARAVILALAEAGAARLVVAGRRPDAAAECAALAGRRGSAGPVTAAQGADLVVDATSVGLAGRGAALPLDLDATWLGPGQLVVDLVYSAGETPLLRAARRQGAGTADGLGMLVHQAALQFSAWTGLEPPFGVMAGAVGR